MLEETDELIQSSLVALEKELDVRQRKRSDESEESNDDDSSPYGRAVRLCPEYVKTRVFRLKFLRAEKFDVQKAADRIEKHWETRLRLFGEQLAFQPRPIRSTDLSEEDLSSLHSHGIQLLPKKDKAGRSLLLATRRKWEFQERFNIGRLFWYLLDNSNTDDEDDDVQRNNGNVVILMYDDGPFEISHFDRKLDRLCIEVIMGALPIRVVAIHHFFDSRVLDLILPFAFFMMGEEMRIRYQRHRTKQDTDVFLENLEQFGILPGMLPRWVKGGSLDFDSEEWLEARRRVEDADG
eukprot:CAMPEP_0194044624 /NCGR_PEP_ID=MMETSP0009_2-20130614/16066_1 /TAXON_ID=210454 /ORGANISM="Grammatophora oceanica, Strain CCMP 410" /LENGTH=293 /DNA_ID=CAMNT_0038689197 /DNA_START=1 /DNA_END=882 /DNA_ORIENTATION=-